jgi:cob(I)alamin adenosyltransferase
MGTARAFCKDEKVKRIIIDIQNQLFTVGAELATLPENYDTMKDSYKIIVPEMVIELEQLIDELDSEVKLPPSFILPGASPGSAVLDLARTKNCVA